ncbi:cytochrome P450 1A1 [Elysia marginata]|uniref:Cytochrome P450 1A1 n=1 Tax=Elysia marginata TaxID=1093978 RepID=A0AAV4F8H5_9GAST|nr:cytochrome P450 1A1 [Elysia marginata]
MSLTDILGLLDLWTVVIMVAVVMLVMLIQTWLTESPNLPPVPGRPHFLLGHLPYLGENRRQQMQEWRSTVGDVFRLYMGRQPLVVLCGYSVLKEALIKNGDHFVDRPPGGYATTVVHDGTKGRRFLLRQRLHETDTVSDRPRSGRPRCTTQRQDRNLVRNQVNNIRQIKGRNNQRISANTVRRRLSTSSPRARRPYIGSILAQRHQHQRTLWPRNMPRGIESNGEVTYSVTNLDSALTMLLAVYVYGEEAVKDTKQIALGNTTSGVEHL